MSKPNKKTRDRRKTTRTKTDPLLALQQMAAPTPETAPVEKPTSRFKSRFFFRIGDDPELEFRKVPPKVEPVNAELVARTDALKKSFPRELSKHIDVVREFFLREIAPLTVSGIAGADQAHSILEGATGSDVDRSLQSTFQTMLTKAAHLRLAQFVGQYMSLDDRQMQQLLQVLQPKRPDNVNFVMAPAPLAEEKYEKQTQVRARPSGGRRPRHFGGSGNKEQGDLDLS